MANRKRDVQILLWVTPEEKKMIRKRMILSKTSNMSVYLRKMAIDGMIVNTDTTYLKAFYVLQAFVSKSGEDPAFEANARQCIYTACPCYS